MSTRPMRSESPLSGFRWIVAVVALACASAGTAFDDVEFLGDAADPPMKLRRPVDRTSRALRTAAPPGDDTTWVGHKGSGSLPNSGTPWFIGTGAPGGQVLGVRNDCSFSNDLLDVNVSIPGATAATFYENVGVNGPYVAAVYAHNSGVRPYVTLVDGWEIEHLTHREFSSAYGRNFYFWNVYANAFGSICVVGGGFPCLVLDVPRSDEGRLFTNTFGLANTPLVRGQTTLRLGVAFGDRVEVRLYDVAGRAVRTLADREFAPGEHVLTWDGSGDDGRALPRGTYFARVRHVRGGFEQARKIVVLR